VKKQNKMALPDSKCYVQFSEHNAYCCVGVGEKLNIRKRRKQKAGIYFINSSLMICTAYRILLVGEIKENEVGVPCGTYSGYRNRDGV
jgi:hypothetical protein